MLPPNATHLLQPLNVCVFSLMKELWRKILQEWKREVRTKGSFNKQFFPSLLKRLVNSQSGSMKSVFLTHIISCWQKNIDAKVALSISRRQKWKSHRQFSKNCIFPNIQLKGVVNKLLRFKKLV